MEDRVVSHDSDDDGVAVVLEAMQWAEVAAALKIYIASEHMKAAPMSRRDALAALLEVDRVMRVADETAAPDDVLGGPA